MRSVTMPAPSTSPSMNPSMMFRVLLGLTGLAGTSATDMILGLSVAMVSAIYWLATFAYSLAMAAASVGEGEVTVISSMRVPLSLATESMLRIWA